MKGKEKVEMRDLGKAYVKKHLKYFVPFLEGTFRPLDKNELKNKETFKELFGDEPFNEDKLKAIYEFQK